MIDNLSVAERIRAFCQARHITVARFEREAGLSNGYTSQLKSAPGPGKRMQIAAAFPELNMGWLLTGEGEMLRPSPQSVGDVTSGTVVGANISGSDNSVSHNDTSTVLRLLQNCQDQLKKKDEQIDRLLALLEKK